MLERYVRESATERRQLNPWVCISLGSECGSKREKGKNYIEHPSLDPEKMRQMVQHRDCHLLGNQERCLRCQIMKVFAGTRPLPPTSSAMRAR